MMMTEDEICRSFKNAAYPRSQVKILSQLNACTEREILAILEARGVSDSLRCRKPPRYTKWTPELRAEAVRLIFEKEMPLSEAAEYFGCSLGAIKKLLSRMGFPPGMAAQFQVHINQTSRKAGICIGKDELCD